MFHVESFYFTALVFRNFFFPPRTNLRGLLFSWQDHRGLTLEREDVTEVWVGLWLPK